MGPAELLAILAHPAVLTLAAWLCFGAALARSGFAAAVASAAARARPWGPWAAAVALGGTCGPALAIPALLPLAHGHPRPERRMLPLAAVANLSAALTMLGSGPLLTAGALARSELDTRLDWLVLWPLAAAAALLGWLWLRTTARWLPARRPLGFLREPEAPGSLVTEVELLDPAGPPADWRVLRRMRAGLLQIGVGPYAPGDLLLVEAAPDSIQECLRRGSARLAPGAVAAQARVLRSLALATTEMLVPPYSPHAGRAPLALRLHERCGVALLALRRRGGAHRYRLDGLRLCAGDVLLVQGPEEGLEALEPDLRLLAPPPRPAGWRPHALWGALALFLVAAALALRLAPPLHCLGAGALGLGLCLRLPPRVLWRALAGPQLAALLLALAAGWIVAGRGYAALPGEWVAQFVREGSGSRTLGVLILCSALATAVLPGSAVVAGLAALVLPATSGGHLAPAPFLCALAFGATIGPLAFPWSTAEWRGVWAAGGHRARDFLALGLPLLLLAAAGGAVILHWYWPMH